MTKLTDLARKTALALVRELKEIEGKDYFITRSGPRVSMRLNHGDGTSTIIETAHGYYNLVQILMPRLEVYLK